MQTKKIIANYYDNKEERDNEKIKAKENGLKVLYECEVDNEYGFTYEITDNFEEEKNKDIDYDNLLDVWHEKVVKKADEYQDKADEHEFGSANYFKYKSYSDALYMALSMLALDEKKARRNLK